MNLGTITGTLSWCKILPLNGLGFDPCRIKTSQETEKSLRKFLGPSQKPKVIHTDNSLKFGTCCEDLSWNHRTSTPHRSETNGIAERAVRRMNELATNRDLAVTTICLGGSRKESFHCPCRGTLLHIFLSEPVNHVHTDHDAHIVPFVSSGHMIDVSFHLSCQAWLGSI